MAGARGGRGGREEGQSVARDDRVVVVAPVRAHAVAVAPRLCEEALVDVVLLALCLHELWTVTREERLPATEHVALGALYVDLDNVDRGGAQLGEHLVEGGEANLLAHLLARPGALLPRAAAHHAVAAVAHRARLHHARVPRLRSSRSYRHELEEGLDVRVEAEARFDGAAVVHQRLKCDDAEARFGEQERVVAHVGANV
mmetsp:Transcript_4229/g.12356  ORF Transcript_4229/g.12356 Transcript_4229/m.12356 type:complete len:200 (+) Transcript_4229:96-695(+)